MDSRAPSTPARDDARFLTTRWSVVLAAGGVESPHRRAALEDLCTAYWYPLYAHVRRSNFERAEAADLTQGFFALLLEREDLRRADPTRGRFRAFLLTALKHFLINERERARAAKRGGDRSALSIDVADAEARFERELRDTRTPERAFARAWAQAVIGAALARLAAEQASIGKGALFEALRSAVAAEDDAAAYVEVARAHGVSENAVKVAVHRWRKRLGELVREEVAGTLEEDGELEAEIRDLFDACGP